jgi:uncharacterized coiled-coil protein SlyX
MLKKLINIAFALLLTLTIGYCETLSLGEISVISGLDQKLKAYIQINNLPKDSQSISWQVSGDEMGKGLSGLKYALETKDDMASLQVTSQEPIHSPVVTLNLLANDGKEQIAASEYTILLDPVTKPVPVDVKQYGPVARGEKLSEVAEKVKPNYVTVDNAANALFYANPHAFENNDSSKLIPGSFLVIPEFSPGVSTLGQNNVNDKRFEDIEEQLGLISSNVSNIDTNTKQRYDELSAYTLQLETLVTKLDARLANLESKTAFMSDDLNHLSKKQETSAQQASTGISKNKKLIKKLEAELTQRWYYLIAAVILIVLIIIVFLWWKKRRESSQGEEVVLDDFPISNNSDDKDVEEPHEENTEVEEDLSDIDDSEATIETEVIKENTDKDKDDFTKDDEYHSRFIKDGQSEDDTFVQVSDEQMLQKAIEDDDGINLDEVEVDLDSDIPNALEDEQKDEVNIVLDDEDEEQIGSGTTLESLENDEVIGSSVNEFELNEEEIHNTSLTDLEKALSEKVSLKEENEHVSNEDDEIFSSAEEQNESEKTQGDSSDQNESDANSNPLEGTKSDTDNKDNGLKLAPLDLTKKK